jgi:lipopolysaccharide/colanic/teichoic acid biosynthesis glycosyltransferase
MLPALAAFSVAWLISFWLTGKYNHKDPYNYFTYTFASHAKAAILFAILTGLGILVVKSLRPMAGEIWLAAGVFALADLMVSLPYRRTAINEAFDPAILHSRLYGGQATSDSASGSQKVEPPFGPSRGPNFDSIVSTLEKPVLEHIRSTIPGNLSGLTVSVEHPDSTPATGHDGVPDLMIIGLPVNNLRRINQFIIRRSERLRMDGSLVCRYRPLEVEKADIKERFGRFFKLAFLTNFIWFRAFPKIPVLKNFYFSVTRGKNRHLSKAEVWGRLSYCGYKIIAETDLGNERIITAQKIALPITNKKPSYYPIVGLTKVGIDGKPLIIHKVRSMYPYSEFLQKQVFEMHGLLNTGKFKNDFRLTEYGPFIRRYWLDEIPGIFDWLRGDIKLVGIRPTSPHFLSLYPVEFIERYIRIKPGLIPTIFDENTQGFDDIVAIEDAYLKEYEKAPLKTDLSYLWLTVKDIFIHKVRSK